MNAIEQMRVEREQMHNWVTLAVNDWFRRQCANPEIKMRLFFKRNGGGLWIGAEPLNESWEDADLTVSCGWSCETCWQRVRDRAHTLPMF